MKNKGFLTLFAFGFSMVSNGQTINRLNIASDAYEMFGKRITVIPQTGPQFSDEIFFTNSVKDFGSSNIDKFAIIKTDDNGAFVAGSLQYYEMEKHHIITTIDNGFLVAGLPNQALPNTPAFLAVMKYDHNLNLQWSEQIPLNPRAHVEPSENVGIEKVYYPNLGEEHYYIACTGGSPDINYQNEGVISVVRLDQQGGLVWHKMYTDVNRPIINQFGYTYQDDGVNDIVAYFDPNMAQTLLCIAGTRRKSNTYPNPNPPQSVTDNQAFYMSVGENGSIVYPYVHHHTNHRALNPDLIWDGNNLVSVYEEYELGPTPIACGTVTDKIGLLRMTPDLSTIVDNHYFVTCQPFLFRGQGISLDENSDYVISALCDVDYNKRFVFFSVNSNTFTTSYAYANINQVADVYEYYDQKHFTDAQFNHYAVPTKLGNSNFSASPALIKADPSLATNCYMLISLTTVPGQGSLQGEDYVESDIDGVEDYSFVSTTLDVIQKGCSIGPARFSDQANTTVETIVERADKSINLNVASSENASGELLVFNAMGQIVQKKAVVIHLGENKFKLQGRFVPGLYVLQIVVDGKNIKSEKVIVPE